MQSLKLKIPPPIYALSFVGLMWLLHQHLPFAQWLSPPFNQAGWVLIAIALLSELHALYKFLKAKTTFNPLTPANSQALVVDGSYRYTRNPMYVGLLIILIGVAMLLGNVSALFVLPVFMLVITEMQIKPEEEALQEKFGQAFIDYCDRTPRWLW